MLLNREAIFAAKRHEISEVKVPEWGGSVYVRTMGGTERDAFEIEYAEKDRDDFRARLVAATCCDESGALLFAPADVVELGKLSFHALDRVIEAASRINRINAQETDDLENQSEEAPE